MENFLINLIHNIRISDIFDIAVVSVLSYMILVWFEKATSRFVLIGIIILGFIYTLSRIFHMYLTEYVLRGFFAILLIAMIVIFQEDLRRFLERLAVWRLVRSKHSLPIPHPNVELITTAVANLARKNWGALIILRGEEFIERHLQGGTTLDGKLSEPLLESIFDPHSNGHDGAVIIEGINIVKFGCQLPLSKNFVKIGKLGLRHTAALGLAERSDALCIVVSEERGTISIARNGTIRTLNNIDQLRVILGRFYKTKYPKETKNKWRIWISEKPWQKAIAVIIACSLWVVFGYQTENIRRDFVMPITYKNLPSDWNIQEGYTKEVIITLTGSKQAFNLFDPKALRIEYDMSKIKEGEQELLLTGEHINHPTNLSAIAIKPDKIKIVAHQLIPRDVPLQIQTTGAVPNGYTLKKIQIIPETIRIYVEKKHSRNITIMTEPINLSDITKITTFSPKLILPLGTRYIEGKQPVVNVTIEVNEHIIQ